MSSATLRLDIVSAEQETFSGSVEMVIVTGAAGELGIMPGHAPLLTKIRSEGEIRAIFPNKEEEIFYVKGGMLEVQPTVVTVLSDTVLRAADIDEEAALAAKERAEKALTERVGEGEIDLAKASSELAEAMAQIQAVRKLKKQAKR